MTPCPPQSAKRPEVCKSPRYAVVRVRGENLLGYSIAAYVRLIRRCDLFDRTVAVACYRWLGKTLAVLTDGAFETAGCPKLAADPRRHCRAGAQNMDEALVTFS
jgi:hypothetical protein